MDFYSILVFEEIIFIIKLQLDTVLDEKFSKTRKSNKTFCRYSPKATSILYVS